MSATRRGWTATCRDASWFFDGPDTAIAAASSAVNVTGSKVTPFLAVHAAVLTHNGITVAIPAASGQGKSTLALALMQFGWTYASDEALLLDWESVQPLGYARPIAASPWTVRTLGLESIGIPSGGDRWYTAASLDTAACNRPGPISMVVLLDRDSSVPPCLSTLHRVDALQTMLHRGFSHYRNPARALTVFAELLTSAEVVRLTYADVRIGAAVLTDLACV